MLLLPEKEKGPIGIGPSNLVEI